MFYTVVDATLKSIIRLISKLTLNEVIGNEILDIPFELIRVVGLAITAYFND